MGDGRRGEGGRGPGASALGENVHMMLAWTFFGRHRSRLGKKQDRLAAGALSLLSMSLGRDKYGVEIRSDSPSAVRNSCYEPLFDTIHSKPNIGSQKAKRFIKYVIAMSVLVRYICKAVDYSKCYSDMSLPAYLGIGPSVIGADDCGRGNESRKQTNRKAVFLTANGQAPSNRVSPKIPHSEHNTKAVLGGSSTKRTCLSHPCHSGTRYRCSVQ